MAPKYDTKVVEIILTEYDHNKTSAIFEAIGDGSQENVNIEWQAYRSGRVKIPHMQARTAASNGEVESFEITATFDNEPLRVARVLGALIGVSDVLKSVTINSGRTVRW